MDKKYLFSTVYMFLFIFLSATAGEGIRERVFVHTDKECYVAGEEIHVKFYTVDQNFQPSALSKVGYVEICNHQKPWIQLKLALDKGSGGGKVKIPSSLPSGIYQLSGYTRYMRNEGQDVFFKRQIAIINASLPPDPTKIELVAANGQLPDISNESTVSVKTDKNVYPTRSRIHLSLDNLPDDIEDLVVSVYRDDMNNPLLKVNKENWRKQVVSDVSFTLPLRWDAEYEGHIIEGKIIPRPDNEHSMVASLSFVGNDIKHIGGRIDPENAAVSFFTSDVYGSCEVVTTITSNAFEKIPNRIDIATPFSEILPDSLPPLQIAFNEKQLLDRYIGVQLQSSPKADSLPGKITSKSYYNLPAAFSYDLDNYTRFSTLNETIIEFIDYVRVLRVENKKRISVYLKSKKRFNTGNILVLLDGVPVHEHERILEYNPQNIKWINIYDGQYIFGKSVFEGMISIITHKQNLPFFQLDDDSQLFIYDCPGLYEESDASDYSEEKALASRKPDYRHTLYWNPFIGKKPEKNMHLSFYTSDLTGKFKVMVEGITRQGEIISGSSYFDVNE